MKFRPPEVVQADIYALCDDAARCLWDNIRLLSDDHEHDVLEEYLYDWGIVLGVLAVEVFESVVGLLRMGKMRAANMLSRALVDYDVRLRYYVVQSWKLRKKQRSDPGFAVDVLKQQMHAARDWDNAPFKLGSVLDLYDPNIWPTETRKALDNLLAANEPEKGDPFKQMLDFLAKNEIKIRGVIGPYQGIIEARYGNTLAGWRMQSAFLHGDQIVVSDVLQFDDQGQKTGAFFQYSDEPPNTLLFMALDHVIDIIESFGMFRSWAPGAMPLRERAGRLWRESRAAAFLDYENGSSVQSATKTFKLQVEETDPEANAAYGAVRKIDAAFVETQGRLTGDPIPGADRETEALRRISLYLGTLFTELFAASTELAMLEMPRAQLVLNRQLLEYFAANRWYIEHAPVAVDELARLPKTVYEEVLANPGAFDVETTAKLEANYRNWAADNPELDGARRQVPSFTTMVALALHKPGDKFWYYGQPSIIAHGKLHGIRDVLAKDATGRMTRNLNSRHHDRVAELRRVGSIALEYAMLIALNFGLPMNSIQAAQMELSADMSKWGLTPETVPVKKYR